MDPAVRVMPSRPARIRSSTPSILTTPHLPKWRGAELSTFRPSITTVITSTQRTSSASRQEPKRSIPHAKYRDSETSAQGRCADRDGVGCGLHDVWTEYARAWLVCQGGNDA